MQHNEEQHARPDGLRQAAKDLEPGRPDRNLLSDERTEAPIDKDLPTPAADGSAGSDETYVDEGEGGRDYFEKRAGDNVRK